MRTAAPVLLRTPQAAITPASDPSFFTRNWPIFLSERITYETFLTVTFVIASTRFPPASSLTNFTT